MLACDSCAGWVHARCDGLAPADLRAIEDGRHPQWGARYVCAVCRRAHCGTILQLLRVEDREYPPPAKREGRRCPLHPTPRAHRRPPPDGHAPPP